jgi:hypothetical protein
LRLTTESQQEKIITDISVEIEEDKKTEPSSPNANPVTLPYYKSPTYEVGIFK